MKLGKMPKPIEPPKLRHNRVIKTLVPIFLMAGGVFLVIMADVWKWHIPYILVAGGFIAIVGACMIELGPSDSTGPR